jgi:hypothetical protein
MPIIEIWGSPRMSQKRLEKLIERCQTCVSHIRELELKPDQVTVFIPKDRYLKGLGEEIIIKVTGLVKNPKRTDEVLMWLQKSLGTMVQETFFPKSLVECLISEMVDERFYWSRKPEIKQKTISLWLLK